MTNACDHSQRLMNDYINGDLSEADQQLLLTHIDACSLCAQELKDLEYTVKAIRTLKDLPLPVVDETFSTEVVRKLKTQQPDVAWFQRRGILKIAAGTIFMVCAAMVVIHLFYMPTGFLAQKESLPVTTAYAQDVHDVLFAENDKSIIAEAGLPVDQWGLIDPDKL